MEDQEDKLYCPNCGSSQLVANKKGFGAGKALTGAVLTGGIGLLAGFIGSGKVKVTCLKCGCKWNPGELLTKEQKDEKENYVKEKIAKEQYEDNSIIAKTKCALFQNEMCIFCIFFAVS